MNRPRASGVFLTVVAGWAVTTGDCALECGRPIDNRTRVRFVGVPALRRPGAIQNGNNGQRPQLCGS